MAEFKNGYGFRKVAPNSKSFDRRSADEGTIRADEPKQLKSFLSFTNAIPTKRAKLFKKKTSADFTNIPPPQYERVSPELVDGSDANLLSSPNEAITRKIPHRRRRSSTAIIKHHRRRRNLSGSDGDCRTVVLRRKRSRHQNGGVNAPPRHVHCNDWREMVTMTENIAPRKSEGDLGAIVTHDGHYDISNRQQTKESIATSLFSINEQAQIEENGAKPEFQYYNDVSQKALDNREKVERLARVRNISGGSSIQHAWIDQTFCKRECAVFIASSKDPNKCGCGRIRGTHTASALSAYNPYDSRGKDHTHNEKWAISRHTLVLPTDSYGTIEFQGGPHPFKAQYLRLNFDSDPADIMSLFEHVWQISPPKLIITVHGGITNFDLQPKLARVFRKGLLKAARTTGAWIFTTGINAGVVRHVAAALEGAISSSKSRSKIVTVGIAPWGLLRKREDLDKVVSYHPHSFPPKGRFAVLNNRSSFFLLVDNGTVGRYGADIILRRRLESYIAEKQKIGSGGRSVPVVCVVLEGGTCTVRTVLDYVTRIPKVPVVVCDGSGRASDLLAFAHQYIQDDGNLPEGVRPQLLRLIEAVFSYDKNNAQCLVLDILACVRQKHMITIFRLGENQKQDVDYAILTALLKGQNLSPAEQLSLALAWNRVDIARSDIFVMGQDWPKASLHNAMLEALIHNRVDFVRLLLENGVSMHDFLTIGRLEELYNTDQGPPNTLYYIVRDVVKIRPGYHYKLIHIGMAVEKLMANGFRSHYTSSEFRHRYMSYRNKCKEVLRRKRELSSQRSATGEIYSHVDDGTASTFALNAPAIPPNNSSLHVENEAPHVLPAISGSRALSNHILWRSAYRRDNFISPSTLMGTNMQQNKETVIDVEDELFYETEEKRRDFKYPFSDLLIWAVLTKRHDMALCMWQHGEEAMAKALVACRLYKSLSKEAAEDYLEVEICEELKKYAEEFRLLSLDLLDHCYKQDDAQTLQLLTYELTYWGYETCLSLSVIVNNKQFLAHPCCQILLADLWHGGLRIRSNSNFKVIMGILFPPSIFLLEFKSREELMLQPQTAAEHEQDINYSSSSSSSESSSSSSSSSDLESEDELSSNHADKHRHPLSTSGAALAAPDTAANAIDKRRGSSASVQSLNLAALFNSKRRKHHKSQNTNNVMTATISAPDRAGIEMKDKSNMSASCENNYQNLSGDIQGPSPAFLSAGVGGAMALSATNIIGAVSSPNTIVSLSNNSISQHQHHVDNDQSNIEPININQMESNENKEQVHQRNQSKILQDDSPNTRRASPPCFIVGGDEEDDESARSARTKIAKFSTKSTPSPSINESFVPDIDRGSETRKGSGFKPTINFEYFAKKPSIVLPKGIPLPSSLSFSRKRQIKFRRKVYEFFVAPVTTFWSWTLSFVAFLVALTYVLLIRTPLNPTYVEWYLLAYVITFGMETIRKFFMSEPKKFKEKVEYFFANYWNFITSVAIIGFLIGFGFRVYPPTRKSVGRVILAVDSVLWSIKLLDFLGVHPRFGPYITMAAKMVMNMSSMVVMLLISLLAFGLVRQSITFPDEEWNWLLVRNIFYKPYFMLYGEVYADEIDVCGDEELQNEFTAWDEHMENHTPINGSITGDACVPGHWIPPLLMTVFLLIANILLISMLIAIFNNIFEQTIKISQQIWLFQRYRQVMEYEGTPFLPPPFTPIYHAFMFAKYMQYRQCCCYSRRSILCVFRRIVRCCCCCCVKPKKSLTKKRSQREHPSGAHPSRTTTQHSRTICRRGDNGLALFDFSLKLFLSEDQVEKLHDFEEECMEDMARNKEIERARSSEERLHRTAERTDLILTRLNDLTSKEMQLKGNVHEIETRIETMESKQMEMLECMRQITLALPSIVQSLQNISSASSPTAQHPSSTAPSAQAQNMPSTFVANESEIRRASPNELDKQEIKSTSQNNEDASTSKNIAEGIRRRNTSRNGTSMQLRKRRANTDLMTGSDGSSQTTIFYPLMQASSTGNANVQQRGRARTTTIGGNESVSNAMLSAKGQNQLFGSIMSLNPSTTPSNGENMRNRKNSSIRRRRRHDEYTSITDAIDIDNIIVTTSTYNITSTAVVPKIRAESGGASDTNNMADSVGSTRPTSILAPEIRRRTTMRDKTPSVEQNQLVSPVIEAKGTEDGADVEDLEEADDEEEEEEDDEEVDYEDEDEEDDDDDDEEYEFHISACSTSINVVPSSLESRRPDQLDYSYLNEMTVADQTNSHHLNEGADETENELVDVENHRDRGTQNNDDDENDDRSSTAPSSQNSTVHRPGTPNTVLKRARASFIRHQNMLFKDYEEEVGRPLEMQSIPTNNNNKQSNEPSTSKIN